MRKIMVCIREVGDKKTELACYEGSSENGTEKERRLMAVVQAGLMVVFRKMAEVEQDATIIDIESPTDELVRRTEKYFSEGGDHVR